MDIQYIDLFSGCGGISLGLYNAGLKGLFAVEKNPDAFSTLKHNLIDKHPHFVWPIWLEMKAWDINHLLKLKSVELINLRGQVDLVVGGPPCQGFSIAGQRNHLDERNDLIFSYLRFIEIIQPQVVVFENVRGFTYKFPHSLNYDKTTYSEILIQYLRDLGYNDARGEMVNFVDYGVPQHRQRFILIATRENISNNIFLKLEENKEKFLCIKELISNANSKSALSDLEQKHGVTKCPDSPRFLAGVTSIAQTNLQKYLRLSNETNYIPDSHRFVHHTVELQEIYKLLLEKAPRNKTIQGKKQEIYKIKKRSLKVLDPNKPAPTITTIPDDCVHYSEPRIMTVRECARLQTFPDWFEFKGPYTTGGKRRVTQTPRYTQVGNAVPPLFAEQIGHAIKEVFTQNGMSN